MKLFVAPHCDDEALFGSYTIMKEKPLVAIYKASEERMKESIEAMRILGTTVVFVESLQELQDMPFDVVYAPMLEHGHPIHDKMHWEAIDIWGDKVVQYSTYRSPHDLLPRGSIKVEPTDDMKERKLRALACYKSQIIATPVHFIQTNKDEYLK